MFKRFINILVFCIISFSVNAYANSGPDIVTDDQIIEDEPKVSDPAEKLNRQIYKLNMHLYNFLRPTVKGYQKFVPDFAKNRVSSFSQNLITPVIFVNNVLQLNFKEATTSFWRFMINTSFGIGGLFDVATETGLYYKKNDFGQTLAVYKAKPGIYLMLPILGPATFRDVPGRIVDLFIDPVSYVLNNYQLAGKSALYSLDILSETSTVIDDVNRTSLDSYSAFRSLYMQYRQQQVNDTIQHRFDKYENIK